VGSALAIVNRDLSFEPSSPAREGDRDAHCAVGREDVAPIELRGDGVPEALLIKARGGAGTQRVGHAVHRRGRSRRTRRSRRAATRLREAVRRCAWVATRAPNEFLQDKAPSEKPRGPPGESAAHTPAAVARRVGSDPFRIVDMNSHVELIFWKHPGWAFGERRLGFAFRLAPRSPAFLGALLHAEARVTGGSRSVLGRRERARYLRETPCLSQRGALRRRTVNAAGSERGPASGPA
jgi:hypothetical protein